jgi:hypothetical protein
MFRGVLALLLAILVVGALIGSGGDLDVVFSGVPFPSGRESARVGAPAAGQAGTPAGDLSLADLKNASPAQLREYARAHPELVAGKSTGELISMYQKFKRSSE